MFWKMTLVFLRYKWFYYHFPPFYKGPEPTLFGKPKFSCMRLHYKHRDTSGYFHTFRAVVRSPEEDGKGNASEHVITDHCNYLTLHYFVIVVFISLLLLVA